MSTVAVESEGACKSPNPCPAGSVATIVESHVGSGAYFSNSVSEVSVGDGAVLNHYKLQNEGPEAYHLAANLEPTMEFCHDFMKLR